MRRQIEKQILQLTGLSLGDVNYSEPTGDPGLFGPDAVCWRIHSDFPAMLCGGISALMLQMLHPLALAGVWDHSNFREDMLGRLRRTSQFVAATTFAPTHEAERLIERVRKIHTQVQGVAPDGRPYSAEDPALLTWVHVCEVYSFLRGYLRYKNPNLSLKIQDDYYSEVALIATKLGAEKVPSSANEIEAYLQRMRGELVYNERTATVMQALFNAPTPSTLTKPMGRSITMAGFDLLPDWAMRMQPKPISRPQRALARAALVGIAPTLRWSLRNGVSTLACRRMGIPPFWQRRSMF
jgi:uncharacterized protein (DUF2236 family)